MSTDIHDYYVTGLRNQHAVEKQAIETIERQLGRMEPFPELHARMSTELSRTQGQRDRLEQLLAKYDSKPSALKSAVTSAVGSVSGLVHVASEDEVVKNVLAAIGFKAYEIAAYKVLATLAEKAGAADDVSVLQQSAAEEQEMGDWLGEHLPTIVQQHVAKLGA
ncbi:MAG: ferritin-like domain-containing protein [Gluconacetobacter diazotrophicus]|nr:ferritin-like domain-containing protein [Gluconacetobacter diazotrophicus]